LAVDLDALQAGAMLLRGAIIAVHLAGDGADGRQAEASAFDDPTQRPSGFAKRRTSPTPSPTRPTIAFHFWHRRVLRLTLSRTLTTFASRALSESIARL
jgi:hypothetical protein